MSQAVKEMWTNASPYLASPVAAGIAIIPVYYGFVAKAALQAEKPVPRISLKLVWDGCKAAPTIGTIVGTQLLASSGLERTFTTDKTSVAAVCPSTTITALASVPAFLIFQGQTLGQSPRETWNSLRFNTLFFKQTGALVARESSFLLAVKIGNFAAEFM